MIVDSYLTPHYFAEIHMDITRRWESHKVWNHNIGDIVKDDESYLVFTPDEFEGELYATLSVTLPQTPYLTVLISKNSRIN